MKDAEYWVRERLTLEAKLKTGMSLTKLAHQYDMPVATMGQIISSLGLQSEAHKLAREIRERMQQMQEMGNG